MKIGKYLSVISIFTAIVFVILKLQFDILSYETMKEVISNGDSSPKLVAGGIKIVLLYIIPVLISLILSIIGMKRKNNYRKAALILNIVTIIYLIIPVGLILSTF